MLFILVNEEHLSMSLVVLFRTPASTLHISYCCGCTYVRHMYICITFTWPTMPSSSGLGLLRFIFLFSSFCLVTSTAFPCKKSVNYHQQWARRWMCDPQMEQRYSYNNRDEPRRIPHTAAVTPAYECGCDSYWWIPVLDPIHFEPEYR
jgi:hypothetical protein